MSNKTQENIEKQIELISAKMQRLQFRKDQLNLQLEGLLSEALRKGEKEQVAETTIIGETPRSGEVLTVEDLDMLLASSEARILEVRKMSEAFAQKVDLSLLAAEF